VSPRTVRGSTDDCALFATSLTDLGMPTAVAATETRKNAVGRGGRPRPTASARPDLQRPVRSGQPVTGGRPGGGGTR
jgi:hypothetical protein